jgi:hypothetical protein
MIYQPLFCRLSVALYGVGTGSMTGNIKTTMKKIKRVLLILAIARLAYCLTYAAEHVVQGFR